MRLTVNTRLVVVLCTATSVAVVLSVQPRPSAAIDEQLPPGSFVVTKSGPAVVRPPTDPFLYTITIKYVGPPRTSSIATRFSERFPVAVVLTPPVFPSSDGVGISDCSNTYGPPQPDGAPGAITLNCAILIDPTRTGSLTIQALAYPTRPGVQTNIFELANGDSGSWTTEFIRDEEPPPPPPPPPPPSPPAALPGPAAAPTKTVSETFTDAGAAEPESVSIAASARTAQVALTWSDPDASFDVTGVRLTSAGRSFAVADRPGRGKLKITKTGRKRALDVRIKNVKRGKLRFKIVAKKLDGPTRVVAKIRQSKR